MPLVWAHAEHLKLLRSLRDGRVFDLPHQTWQRYVIERTRSRYAFWRFNHKLLRIDPGLTLRLETLARCVVRWSIDGWSTPQETPSRDTGLGAHIVDLPTDTLADWRPDRLHVPVARRRPVGRRRIFRSRSRRLEDIGSGVEWVRRRGRAPSGQSLAARTNMSPPARLRKPVATSSVRIALHVRGSRPQKRTASGR